MTKVALISGGLGDIGLAIARSFLKNGYLVSIGDLKSKAESEAALHDLKHHNRRNLHYRQVDMVSGDAVCKWIGQVKKKWGIPQVIIVNAGVVVRGMLLDIKHSDVREQIDINFWGAYNLAVESSRIMKDNNSQGSIIFIGSWTAERPAKGIPAYCISKAAVRMLCKSLALELAEHKILVNELALGIVDGGLSKQNQQKNPGVLDLHLNATPTHELVSLNEISKWVMTLSDFENSNITGSTIVIDGGLSLTSKMTQ